jgi:hypothetical protein
MNYKEVSNKSIYIAIQVCDFDGDTYTDRQIQAISKTFDLVSQKFLKDHNISFEETCLNKYKENPVKYLRSPNKVEATYCSFLIKEFK